MESILAFSSRAYNERAHSPLPASRTLCVTLRLLGRWMELFFYFLTFFKAWDKLLQPLSLVKGHANRDVAMG